MTNQQLKAHCEDVIANPQEHSEILLAMAKALLPCLEAEPRGWLTWHAIPPTWSDPGGGGEYLAFHESKPENGSDDGTDSWPVYDAPPAPELKLPEPINWREAHSLLDVNQCGEDRFEAFRMGANWRLGEVKRLNGVKS